MASTVHYEFEEELKSPANAFWNTIKDMTFVYPKILPERYESIKVLEGDGRSVGTTRLISYVEGFYFGKGYKSKIVALDEENKSVTCRVLEGDLLKMFKCVENTIAVKPKGNGCVVVWSIDYEKAIKEAPDGEQWKDSMVETFHKLDAYTLTNN